MTRTRLKVCCIASREEAALAIRLGADALGLVSAMPTGPGVISDARCAEIARAVPPPVASVLLTSRTRLGDVMEQVDAIRPTAVQLVDATGGEVHEALREAGVNAIQVIHVEDARAVIEAEEAARTADALLLDSGRPSERVLGGTGLRHDWSVSAEIVRQSAVPVFLAGGLTARNVAEAIREVRPFALDVCSGVRTDGALDAGMLAALVAAMAEA